MASPTPFATRAPHAPDAPIRFGCLGRIELLGAPASDEVVTQPLRVALLTLLCVDGARGFVRRDRLAALLWPELDQAGARGALRRALYALRRALGEAAIEARGEEELRADPAIVWCDAVAFDAAVAAGHHARALELYVGPLLEGFHVESAAFDPWLSEARRARHDAALESAWALATTFETQADLTQASRWARRVARLAQTDERRLRGAMGLLARTGNRADAVRVYEEFVVYLRREFDVAPSAETQELARQLRAN
ncbi:MAG: hypothetical protein K2X99_12890 [Gemmatimonadaceae bacterium]|nr:hypothetical protein [Gemmatimonadaceae bacterium]